ncbi:MAG TPA: dual specificity protein phosphatase family protein [Planctomycetota bacterium]
MVTLYWFDGPGPGRVGVMPRPEPVEEIVEMAQEGVTTVVSLLETHEIRLYALEREPELCASEGIDFLHYPIRDHGVPREFSTAAALVKDLAARYGRGESIIVHCLGGVGRSPTIAGATLVERGERLPDVIRRMRESRGYPVPEMPEQYEWMERYAEGRI